MCSIVNATPRPLIKWMGDSKFSLRNAGDIRFLQIRINTYNHQKSTDGKKSTDLFKGVKAEFAKYARTSNNVQCLF